MHSVRGQLIKRYFITGLLIWVPLVITGWVLSTIVSALDQSLRLLPETILAANFIGQKLVGWWNKLLSRIPVVNSVYKSVKQVSDTLFAPNGNAFRKTLLVQYPRHGSWTIAFMTGQPGGDLVNHLTGSYVSVYVPTTPNPTSGFFLMMPASEVIELDMTVDEALKYIISMGVVAPPAGRARVPQPASALLNK